MKHLILFAIPVLIWGSTWLVITFQLGIVDPLLSVFYRFIFSAILLLVYSYFSRLNLTYSWKQHGILFLLGTCLFGINYWLVYMAEQYVKSGLVAIVFSTIIFLNIFFGALFLKSRIRSHVVISAIMGFAGVALIFRNELMHFNLSDMTVLGFLLALTGAVTASLGNIISAYLQREKIPVVQANAFGMLYGSLLMLIIALMMGKPLVFDPSFAYISSLLYLSVFGSVIAFWSYLTLLGRIGADKVAYATLVIPVIALVLSTVFEGYQWNLSAVTGVVLIIVGNVMVLRKRRKGIS